jgi:hypothetical protein
MQLVLYKLLLFGRSPKWERLIVTTSLSLNGAQRLDCLLLDVSEQLCNETCSIRLNGGEKFAGLISIFRLFILTPHTMFSSGGTFNRVDFILGSWNC